MKIIRWILGNILLLLNWLFTPRGMVRDQTIQSKIDLETKQSLMLYELQMCPFCIKVRRAAKRLSLNIPQKDVGVDDAAQAELMAGGKVDQVPCLRISTPEGKVEWLYESTEIVNYLNQRFA